MQTFFKVEKRETSIPGLLYLPSIIDEGVSDSDDISMKHVHDHGYSEALNQPFSVSQCNCAVVKSVMDLIGNNNKGILEIGLNADYDTQSITYQNTIHKPLDIPYLGVDVQNRTYLNKPEKNMHFLWCESRDHIAIKSKLQGIGIDKLSLLIIDGDHSVDSVISDFQLSDVVEVGGIILFHDTNIHPGPCVFLDALDPEYYKVKKHCTEDKADWGIAVAQKLK